MGSPPPTRFYLVGQLTTYLLASVQIGALPPTLSQPSNSNLVHDNTHNPEQARLVSISDIPLRKSHAPILVLCRSTGKCQHLCQCWISSNFWQKKVTSKVFFPSSSVGLPPKSRPVHLAGVKHWTLNRGKLFVTQWKKLLRVTHADCFIIASH